MANITGSNNAISGSGNVIVQSIIGKGNRVGKYSARIDDSMAAGKVGITSFSGNRVVFSDGTVYVSAGGSNNLNVINGVVYENGTRVAPQQTAASADVVTDDTENIAAGKLIRSIKVTGNASVHVQTGAPVADDVTITADGNGEVEVQGPKKAMIACLGNGDVRVRSLPEVLHVQCQGKRHGEHRKSVYVETVQANHFTPYSFFFTLDLVTRCCGVCCTLESLASEPNIHWTSCSSTRW